MTTIVEKKCPICNSTANYIFTSKNNKKIFQCCFLSCGHFFTPMLKADQGICMRPDDLEKESNESLKIFDKRNLKLLKLFKSNFKNQTKQLRFLDFGAGNGHISRTFKRILKDKCIIYCLDTNPLVKNFYSKFDLKQIESSSELLDKIDLIYMIEVIEHLENPIAVMKTLSRLLDANGQIFITTPIGKNKENLTNAFDTASHLHFFTQKSLNLTLIKSGFLEIDYKFHPEMHAPSLKSDVISKNINLLKLFIKIILSKIAPNKSINHLVGFTKLKD